MKTGIEAFRSNEGTEPFMSLASPALLFVCFYTHSLRCGLEECRQLRWLYPKITRSEH